MSIDPKRVQAVFLAAVAQPTAADRAAYLDEVCGQEVELRQRVELLLRAHDEPGSFLGRPAQDPRATVAAQPGPVEDGSPPSNEQAAEPCSSAESPGTVIGRYKLLEQIGEGGFGIVFLAEQQEPIRRKVALKLLKPGMDSKQVIARFEVERQALALMDHPNIAKILDGGQTSSGRPYFVMDLVKGLPLTDFCDQGQLTPRERLGLFVDVCQAVQHAHQKGVIHRDLKPSNVLVTLQDGRPLVKVIDFGIAKALGQQLTDKTLFTGFAQMIGTPLYMSPEQAALSNVDVDTRSDIYSLGVLLYEVLTGMTPFDKERLQQAGYDEMRRIIREEEPPRPSTRISTLGQAATTLSTQRKSDPKRLSQLFRGELDWIVMKALEKDRNRRYETASAFAADVQRYLHDEAVEACPPSAAYRLRKFAHRYKRLLTTAAAFAVVLLVGAVVSTFLAVWALRAESEAREAERLANQRLNDVTQQKNLVEKTQGEVTKQLAEVKQQKDRAVKAEGEATAKETRARAEEGKAKASEAEARSVLRFFADTLLAAARPKDQEGGLGPHVTIRQAADAAEPKIAGAFAAQPLVEASIRNTLGMTYLYVGEPARAVKQLERALALRRQGLGYGHLDTLRSMINFGEACRAAGRLADAMLLFREATQRMGISREFYQLLGWKEMYPISQVERSREFGTEFIRCLNNLIEVYLDVGDTALANNCSDLCIMRLQQYTGSDPAAGPVQLRSENNYLRTGWILSLELDPNIGPPFPIDKSTEKIIKDLPSKLGPDHPDTLVSMANLALAYQTVGRRNEALALLEKALPRMRDRLGADHPLTLTCLLHLGRAYRAAGQPTKAQPLEDTVKRLRAKLSPNLLLRLLELAAFHEEVGDFARAAAIYRQLADASHKIYGPPYVQRSEAWDKKAEATERRAKLAELKTPKK